MQAFKFNINDDQVFICSGTLLPPAPKSQLDYIVRNFYMDDIEFYYRVNPDKRIVN